MALQDRMIRAVAADRELFEEVEHDPSATTEAMAVVALVAVAGGFGSLIGLLAAGRPGAAVLGLVVGVATQLIGWAVFSGVTYFIGSRLFDATATWEEVLRTLGFAYTPMLVGFIGWIPVLGGLIVFLAALWTLYLAYVAIRTALDITAAKTIATIVLSIIPAGVIAAIISLPLTVAVESPLR